MPKSTILTKSGRPSRSMRNTFSGLRSRWTMPLSCAAPSARAICDGDADRAVGRERRAVLDRLRQRRAVDVLHHRVRHALGRLAEVGDVDDVRMADARRRLRLLDEARDRRLVAHDLALEHLDRERALDHGVLDGEHDAHAALADLALHVVAAVERLADEPVVLAASVCAGSSSASVALCAADTRAPACRRRRLGSASRARLDVSTVARRAAIRRQHRRLVGRRDGRAAYRRTDRSPARRTNADKPGTGTSRSRVTRVRGYSDVR